MNFTEKQKKAIMKRDNFECQLSKKFGISELTGVSCSEDLEIHHKIYRGDKQYIYDGITVCQRCHELLTDGIRRNRYLSDNRLFDKGHESRELWRQ